MKKTLYVTDLDATLLRNDKSVSEATARILNFLIDRGMLITYATARSGHSAAKLVGDIDFRLPAIIRNGTVFADPKTGRETEIIMFAPKEEHSTDRRLLPPSFPGIQIHFQPHTISDINRFPSAVRQAPHTEGPVF